MAYDEKLAAKIEDALGNTRGITTKKMFGGLCFLHNGNMLCGIDKNRNLMVRVGPEQYDEALAQKHAREMDFTGRPLKGMIYVSPDGYKTKAALSGWVQLGLNFTGTLSPK
jgi:TfoX/Sxy family transcriptional regulator of competence genes